MTGAEKMLNNHGYAHTYSSENCYQYSYGCSVISFTNGDNGWEVSVIDCYNPATYGAAIAYAIYRRLIELMCGELQ